MCRPRRFTFTFPKTTAACRGPVRLTGMAFSAGSKQSGYDGYLTIEAFGRALPALAAATKVWRRPVSRRARALPRRAGAYQFTCELTSRDERFTFDMC